MTPGCWAVDADGRQGLVVHATEHTPQVLTAAPFVPGRLVYELHALDGWTHSPACNC